MDIYLKKDNKHLIYQHQSPLFNLPHLSCGVHPSDPAKAVSGLNVLRLWGAEVFAMCNRRTTKRIMNCIFCNYLIQYFRWVLNTSDIGVTKVVSTNIEGGSSSEWIWWASDHSICSNKKAPTLEKETCFSESFEESVSSDCYVKRRSKEEKFQAISKWTLTTDWGFWWWFINYHGLVVKDK